MELKEILNRVHNKKLYYSNNDEFAEMQLESMKKLYEFNNTYPWEIEKREKLLKEMFAEVGENCYIEPPLRANWGGKNVHLGKTVYANFNLTLVDDTDIYIGDNVLIAPNVVITTGTHPVHPEIRRKQGQYNVSVRIGNNVWIGASSVILPGVTIGDNTVIGAGSVVTKDIPAGVVAFGNPCKVFRKIDKKDYEYYYKQMKVDIE